MANDIRVSLRIEHTKDPRVPWSWPGVVQMDQTGAGVYQQTLSIGTTAEDVAFGDIAPGLVVLVNLDDTNYVEFGMSDGGTIKKIGTLPASSRVPAMFMLATGQTLRMQANTGACNVHVVAWEL